MSEGHERLKDKLRRILALAESGIDGERENAKRMLDELLKKHGLRIEDLRSEEASMVQFRVSDPYERGLLICVIVFVTGTRKVGNHHTDRCWYFELTKVQEIDAKDCFEHYVKMWRENLSAMLGAFVNKYNIALPADGDSKMRSEEEMERMMRLARALKGEEWERRLKLAESTLA